MKIEVDRNPGREWDEFAAVHTDIIFFKSIWGEVLKQGIHADLQYYCLVDNGIIRGGMPAITFRMMNIKLFYSSIPYGGYIGEEGYCAVFYQELLKMLRESTGKPDIAYFTPSPFDAKQPENELLKNEISPITYIDIGCKSLAAIESGFRRGVMQSVRKSRKNALTFELSDDERHLKTAYSLYRETMIRNGAIVRYREEWFKAIHQCLIKRGMAHVGMVLFRGEPIASVIPVYSGRGAHLLNNGSSTSHLPLRANDFMIYEIIRHAITMRLEYVDLMNSEVDDRRLIAWKEKFGSVTVCRQKYTLVNSPTKKAFLDVAKLSYPVLARYIPGVQ